MATVEFQTPFGSAITGTIEVPEVLDSGSNPHYVIQRPDPWKIVLRWTIKGNGAGILGGEWVARALLEKMGTGTDQNLKEKKVPMDYAAPTDVRDYTTTIDIPGNTVTEDGVFKLVVAIVHYNMGVPMEMAGFAEGPMVQFYSA